MGTAAVVAAVVVVVAVAAGTTVYYLPDRPGHLSDHQLGRHRWGRREDSKYCAVVAGWCTYWAGPPTME